jgi:hypothetical protein
VSSISYSYMLSKSFWEVRESLNPSICLVTFAKHRPKSSRTLLCSWCSVGEISTLTLTLWAFLLLLVSCYCLHSAGGPSLKPFMAVLWVAHPQGGQPAVNFYPIRHPTPYAYGLILKTTFKDQTQRRAHFIVGKIWFDSGISNVCFLSFEMCSFLDKKNCLKMIIIQKMADKISTWEDPKFEIWSP